SPEGSGGCLDGPRGLGLVLVDPAEERRKAPGAEIGLGPPSTERPRLDPDQMAVGLDRLAPYVTRHGQDGVHRPPPFRGAFGAFGSFGAGGTGDEAAR